MLGNLILILIGVVVFSSAVLALALFLNKKVWLKDANENWIPDVFEDKISDVKDELEDLKDELHATKIRLNKELKDVVKAVKEVGNQLGDVPKAFSGKKRPGRKENGTK